VPYDDSVTLWVNSRGLELIAIGADHRLNDAEAQQALAVTLARLVEPPSQGTASRAE
jgi:hypothetical protein